jgi:hypothetical protein
MNANEVILAYIHEAIWTGGLAVLTWVILFPFRHIAKYVRTQWEEKSKLLTEVHQELTLQRTNCLTTLQAQGAEQTKAIEKVADVLTNIRYDLAEQTGYIKALKE